MGNTEIKSAMQKVMDDDYDKPQVLKFIEDHGFQETDSFDKFFELIEAGGLVSEKTETGFLSKKMKGCFPFNSQTEFTEHLDDKTRWKSEVTDLWQLGYTTWQQNIDELKQKTGSLALKSKTDETNTESRQTRK